MYLNGLLKFIFRYPSVGSCFFGSCYLYSFWQALLTSVQSGVKNKANEARSNIVLEVHAKLELKTETLYNHPVTSIYDN